MILPDDPWVVLVLWCRQFTETFVTAWQRVLDDPRVRGWLEQINDAERIVARVDQ